MKPTSNERANQLFGWAMVESVTCAGRNRVQQGLRRLVVLVNSAHRDRSVPATGIDQEERRSSVKKLPQRLESRAANCSCGGARPTCGMYLNEVRGQPRCQPTTASVAQRPSVHITPELSACG